MSARAAILKITAQARRASFAILKGHLLDCMPKGWSVVLGVGWGIVVLDESETPVRPGYNVKPAPMIPKRLLKAMRLAYEFEEVYGFANERITKR